MVYCNYHEHHQNARTAALPSLRRHHFTVTNRTRMLRNGCHSWHPWRIFNQYLSCILLSTFILVPVDSWSLLFPSSFHNVNMYCHDRFLYKYRKSHTITNRRWLQYDDTNENDDTDTSTSATGEENLINASKFVKDDKDAVGSSITDSSDVDSSSIEAGVESVDRNEATYQDNMTDRFKYKVRSTKQSCSFAHDDRILL